MSANWKQLSAQKYSSPSNQTSQIIKIKSENIRLQAQIKEKQKINRELAIQIEECKQNISYAQKGIKDLLNSVGYHITNDYQVTLKELMTVLTDKIQQNLKKILEQQSKLTQLNQEQSLNEMKQADLRNKVTLLTEECQAFQRKIEEMVKEKQEQINELLHTKLSLQQEIEHLTKQNSDLRREGSERKGWNSDKILSEQIKRECRQLLSQIAVEDDQYLRGYLIQDTRKSRQRPVDTYSRRDKYGFIFDH